MRTCFGVGALRERGPAFVKDMMHDEAFNRKVLVELTLKISRKHGSEMSEPESLQLRDIVKKLAKQFPNTKKLRASKTAAVGAVETAYVEYLALSLDAVHCSVTALGRHLSSEWTESKSELTVHAEARTTPVEQLQTVLHACRTLMGVAVGANELLGFTNVTAELGSLVTEFEKNGWVRT
jgi:hypothetical protein